MKTLLPWGCHIRHPHGRRVFKSLAKEHDARRKKFEGKMKEIKKKIKKKKKDIKDIEAGREPGADKNSPAVGMTKSSPRQESFALHFARQSRIPLPVFPAGAAQDRQRGAPGRRRRL